MSSNKYFVNNLFISNFKSFKPSVPPLSIPFTNSDGDNIQFMMLSGYNGYGKTSIFQAIEFILNGKIEIFQFKDTTRKYTEHISINELDKESLLVLELVNKDRSKYISIVRYNQCVKACKEKDLLEEDKSFELFMLEDKFEYKVFLDKRENADINEANSNDIASVFNEKDFDEWLNANYLKQEQGSNILFKSNNDRVNFVNQFIELDSSKYFEKYNVEKDLLSTDIKQLTEGLKELKTNISKKQVASIGEKPENVVLFVDTDFVWNKMEYADDEEFEEYIKDIDDLKIVIEKIESFVSADRIDGISKLLKQPELLKNILIYNNLRENVGFYINQFKKKEYLIELSKDDDSILSYKINNIYISDDMRKRICNLREKVKNVEKLKSSKEKIYQGVKKIRDEMCSNQEITTGLFGERCPLCGHDYKDKVITFSNAIQEYETLFTELSNCVEDNSKNIQKNIDDEIKSIKNELIDMVVDINIDKEVYNYLINIEGKAKEFNGYVERLEYLINDNTTSLDSSVPIDIKTLEQECNNMIRVLNNSLVTNREILSSNPLDDSEIQILEEKKRFLTKLNKMNGKDILEQMKKKRAIIQWYLLKKQYKKYSNDVTVYKKNYDLLREKHLRDIQLGKLLFSVKKAKNQYMSDLIRFIEIPLYIYSGKLLQTHQNGLGVYCTTGSSADNVTQFKLTTNANITGHDIVNKFSSGQKAVMNISIILAFRKIRASSLNFFMIDDPCQSMDDINIASLTEILRNEFTDTQIMISTHDDSTAAYMCYKYKKAGKEYRNLNVQKEFYSFATE